jgi:hypothetical protein
VAVKLHRCSTLWAKNKGHPCWRVLHALGTGQSRLPAIQLEDGSWYRKESSEMAAEIGAGVLSG